MILVESVVSGIEKINKDLQLLLLENVLRCGDFDKEWGKAITINSTALHYPLSTSMVVHSYFLLIMV